jgi:hypothetical protein
VHKQALICSQSAFYDNRRDNVSKNSQIFSLGRIWCDSCADAFRWGIPARAFSRPDKRRRCWATEKEHLLFSHLEPYYISVRVLLLLSGRLLRPALKSEMCSSSVLYGAARYNLCFTSMARSRGRNNSSGLVGALQRAQGESRRASDVGSSGSQIKKNPSLVLLLHAGPRSRWPGPLLFYHQRALRDIIQLSLGESGKLTRLIAYTDAMHVHTLWSVFRFSPE